MLTTGAVLKADTIEALASEFGADPRVFKATVDRYNELVKMGKDLDFGKKSEFMTLAIDKPPSTFVSHRRISCARWVV